MNNFPNINSTENSSPPGKLNTAKEISELAENIINTVREPLIVLDKDLRVVKASKSFYDFFKVSPNETVGTLIYNLGNNQWDIPKLRDLLETILPEKTTFDNFEVEHVFSVIGKRTMLLNARKIQGDNGNEQIILLAIEDITERKLAEEALNLSEIRYRTLFESAKDGILILDSESGKIVDVNPFLINLLGYPKDHFLNKTIWEIGVFKDIVADQNNYLEFKQKGYNRIEHLPLDTMDGRKIDIEFISHVNISDHLKLTQCNIRDITKHKQIEELLRESEELFRHSFEYAATSVCIVGLDGKFLRVNSTFQQMFGYSQEEISHLSFSDITHPDDLDVGLDLIKIMIRGDSNKSTFEKRYIKKDKSIIWASISTSLVRNSENQPQFFISQIIDITGRKQLEESLKKQKDEFETIFNLVPAQIWYKDTHNNFLRVNRQTCTDLGIAKDKIEGHSAEDLFPDFSEQYFKDDIEVFNSGKPKLGVIEQINNAKGDLRWVHTDKIPVFDEDGKINGLIALVKDITEEKLTEEALRNSETLLRTLVQTIPDLIWLKDINGVYLSCNKMFERLYGAGENDILGKTDFDFVDKELAEFFLIQDHKAIASGNSIHYEEFLTFADDGHHTINDTIKTPLYDSNCNLIGVLGISRDITARKENEKQIKDSEKRFRAIFDQSPITMALMDSHGHPIISNPAMSKMLGYTKDELSQMHFIDYTHPEDADLDLNQFNDLLQGKISNYTMEKRYIHKNGNIVWANMSVTMLRDSDTSSYEIIGMAEDITERKLAEEKLHESETKYKELTVLLPQSVFEADINGIITFANDYVIETFGYSKEEALNKISLQDMVIPEEQAYLSENMRRTLKEGNKSGREYTLIRKDRTTFPALVYANPIIRNGILSGIRGVVINISEIKKTQMELIKAKEKAESANKLKDAFIANISHEIRTPLNGILGIASIIKDIFKADIKKEDEELFEGIEYSSQRLIRTVDMMLNYSRMQVGEFPVTPVNLNISAICHKLITEYSPAAKRKSLELIFQNKCGNANLYADEFSIFMAVSNLIDNAIKYTNHGTVSVILYRNGNDDIMIDIIDTGIGIDQEFLEKIFNPYSQEQMGYGRAYEGVGLGLSMVKKVVALNNGKVFVKSKKGEGTTFTLYFGKEVKLNNPEIVPVINSPQLNRLPGSGLILLVEDDLINQTTIKRFIGNNYSVITTASSDNVVEILKKNKIDIILMDISIQGSKDGLELTQEIKAIKEFSRIPVIAITAHAFDIDRQNALEAGCDNFLAKPFSKESLLDLISSIIP